MNPTLRFIIALLIGTAVAAFFGFLIGIPVLRLRGDYLAIVTLAFGEIIKNVINVLYVGKDENGLHFAINDSKSLNMSGTGEMIIDGAKGITGTPRQSTFLIGVILILVALFVVFNLVNSRSGRAIMAIRDNRIAAESVGINITKFKLMAFTISAAIAGAGGAATAIEIQAALDGVKEISIFNIHDKFWANAEETVRKINEKTDCKATLYDLDDKEKLREEMADSYIFVNGTGVGMKPLEGMSVVPDKSFFRPELIVIDVPYSPLETKMRSMAKEVGCKTMNGLGMMLFQGAAAFKLWTGKDMPIEHMKEVLNIRYDD